MPNFDLATGYVTFKGDFSKFEADIQKAQKKVEGLNNSFKGKQFEMAAHAAMAVNKQLELAQKNAKRMMDEIRYGKMGLMFRDAGAMLQKFQQRMQAFGAVGVGVGAAAVGAASVASPLAADTLQGSVKLLTATIGKDFVPMVMQLSFALQDAARWWKQLDPAIKSATAETVKMVAVAGGAALALAGVGKVLSFIMSHPLVSAAGVGIGAGFAINKAMNAAGDAQIAAANAKQLNRKDVLDDERMKQLRSAPLESALALAEDDFKKAWKRFDRTKGKLGEYQAGNTLGGSAARAFDLTQGGKIQETLIREAAEAQEEFQKTKIRWTNLAKKETRQSAIDSVIGAGTGGASGAKKAGGGGEYALGSMGPTSYSSLQDFYRAFNVEATSGSSLDAQLLQIQTETRDGILAMNRTIEQKLGKAQ